MLITVIVASITQDIKANEDNDNRHNHKDYNTNTSNSTSYEEQQ